MTVIDCLLELYVVGGSSSVSKGSNHALSDTEKAPMSERSLHAIQRRFVIVRRLSAGLPVLLFLVVLVFQSRDFKKAYSSSQHDLKAYVACAHNILNGRHIYRTHHRPIPEDPTLGKSPPRYLYPPLLGILLIPLTLLSFDIIRQIWFFANFFFVLHTAYLVVKVLPFRRARAAAFFLVSAAAVGSDPFIWLIRTAQVDACVMYLCTAGLYHFGCRRYLLAASLVAVATWIKVTPGIFLLYFFLRGNFRFRCSAVITAIVPVVLQAAVCQEEFLYFFTDVLHHMPNLNRAPAMQSLWVLSSLLVIPYKKRAVFNCPECFDALLFALKGIVAAISAAVLVRFKRGRPSLVYGFAVCSACSILIVDFSWMMRFIANLITSAALIYLIYDTSSRSTKVALGVLGTLSIAVNNSFIWRKLLGPLDGWKSVFLCGPSLHALIALLLLGIAVIRRSEWIPLVQRLLDLLKNKVKRKRPTAERT